MFSYICFCMLYYAVIADMSAIYKYGDGLIQKRPVTVKQIVYDAFVKKHIYHVFNM